MKANSDELIILAALSNCRFMPGSFDKKFGKGLDPDNISPLQRYYIYKLGYKYRKQIYKMVRTKSIENTCANFLATNRQPLSRREAERLAKQALRSPDPESGATESNQLNLGI